MEEKLTSITRSFTYKLNLGNYSNVDFFCSQSKEVPESEAEEASKSVHDFCMSEVVKSVREFIKLNRAFFTKPELFIDEEKQNVRAAGIEKKEKHELEYRDMVEEVPEVIIEE